MKYRGRFPLLSLIFLLIGPVVVLAQAMDCPAIVRTALAATEQFCDSTGRNQACYGNITLEVEAQAGAADFQFDEPGDVVDVAQVKTLRLSPLDEQQKRWGVALMRIQANVPDTLPGQNVTFLLFGDVEIQNAGQSNLQPVTLEVTAIKAVIVYEQPVAESSIAAGIIANAKMMADGQSLDQLWLRVRLPADSAKYGWIHREDVTGGDFSQLPMIDFDQEATDNTQSFRPMQAFYFKTGFHDRPCAQAPDSGILIQAPENAGPIELRVNEVDITLGSTAYLQAQPGGEMTISVIEGAALVEANGEARAIPAGTQVRVPMNERLEISGQPGLTEPYDLLEMQSLPIHDFEQTITVERPLTLIEINGLSVPKAGEWIQTSNGLSICNDGTTRELFFEEKIRLTDVTENSFTIIKDVNPDPYKILVMTRSGSLSYDGEWRYVGGGILGTYKYEVISPERIAGKITFYRDDGCREDIIRILRLSQ